MSSEQKAPELVYSRDGEIYQYDDLRDVIEVYDLQPGDVIHVGERGEHSPADYIDADSIIEQMGERAMDVGGEAAEDFPDVSKEAREELKSFLTKWANQHARLSFFPVINDREYTITQEDADSA